MVNNLDDFSSDNRLIQPVKERQTSLIIGFFELNDVLAFRIHVDVQFGSQFIQPWKVHYLAILFQVPAQMCQSYNIINLKGLFENREIRVLVPVIDRPGIRFMSERDDGNKKQVHDRPHVT